jgi:hypothetical protein
MSRRERWGRWRALWAGPLAIGTVVAAGLGAALVFEGPGARAAVCIGLAAPVLTAAWFALRRAGARVGRPGPHG